MIHQYTTVVDTMTDILMRGVYITFIVIFLLSFIILLAFHFLVYRPLHKITEAATQYASGNLEYEIPVTTEDEMGYLSASLNYMSSQLRDMEDYQKKFVANVSHDIKTPLTSIISYIELLKQEENLSPEIQDYIRILEEKSERLKNMVQDVFSVSKAASGQLAVEMEEIDFGKLLRQTLADMDGEIQKSPYKFKIDIPKEAVMVYADGDRMYRVFQNLIGNALKYSLEGSRIYISLKTEKNAAVADIRNTSRSELKQDVDFTARFTRGDESRTDGGSGLGLSIAKSFTEACGGIFEVETMADLFTVKVSFELRQQ